MRLVTLLLCLALTGCITTDDPAQTTAQPAAAAATPPGPDKPAAAPGRRPAQATRGSTAPPAPPPEEEPQDPVLVIRQTCWSQGNANKALRTLETRADWVNKCIADKTKEQAAR